MAEPANLLSGLAQANFYGQDPNSPERKNLMDALEAGQQALETRYANPNWFSIAAGFAKPQLGGFTASLGSAAEAMGATEENRRKDVLTASQYRAQVAVMKNQMSQNQKVNDLVANHTGPVTADLLKRAVQLSPDAPATKSLQAEYEGLQKERSMSSSEYGNAMNAANALYTSGTLTKAGLAEEVNRIKAQYGPKPKGAAVATAPDTVAAAPTAAPAPDAAAPSAAAPDAVAPAIPWAGTKLSDQKLAELKEQAKTDPKMADVLRAYNTAMTPAQTYETAGAQGDAATSLTKDELKNINDMWGPKVASIVANEPAATETRANNFYRAATLLNKPEVQAAMGQTFKEQGFGTALLTAIKKGINLAVASPTGGWNAAVAAPVDEIMTAYNVNPKVRPFLIELNRIATEDAISDIREGTKALGGGHTNASEYEGIMSRIANTNEPHKLMQQFFAVRAAKNDFNAKVHDAWIDYTSTPGFATKPTGSFFKTKEYKDLVKELGKNQRKAQTIAD